MSFEKLDSVFQRVAPGMWKADLEHVDATVYAKNTQIDCLGVNDKRDAVFIASMGNLRFEILAVLKETKEAISTIDCIKLHLNDIRAEINDTIHEGSVKHSTTNLWNCLSYLEACVAPMEALENKMKEVLT